MAQELKKHIPDYDKTETFFNKTHIYRELKEKGDMAQAIELSRGLDKLHATAPEVYKSSMSECFGIPGTRLNL